MKYDRFSHILPTFFYVGIQYTAIIFLSARKNLLIFDGYVFQDRTFP